MGDLSTYPEGTYVDDVGRAIVVLRRPDQPVDYAQVKGIVMDGIIYPIAEGESNTYSTRYRALDEDGNLWVESSDLEEVRDMTRGQRDLTVQAQTTYLVSGPWMAV